MSRLPAPGSDVNTWGDILNDYLSREHNADGTQKALPQSKITNLVSDLAAKDTRLDTIESGEHTYTKLKLPNITITDEANPVVNAIQFGEDASGALKEQHITTADQLGSGPGANLTVNPGAAKGTNQAGAVLRLSSGISTGNNGSGPVVVLTSSAGAPGAQENAQADAWYFWGTDLGRALTPGADGTQDIGFDVLRIRHVKQLGFHEISETADPPAPTANNARLYTKDNGAGKTQLCVRFATGVVQVITTEP